MKTVAVLVGSLRAGSLNRKFAESLAKLAEGKLAFKFVEIGDLPLYNEDLWENPPTSVLRLKNDIETADGVLFVTPEYNRTYAPAIDNAIHWGTRPWGKNSWAGKPAAIAGTSPGAIGAAVGQSQLKQVLVVVGMALMGQPEVYFAYKDELFDDEGHVVNEQTAAFLQGFVDSFAAWIDRVG
ncbi:chromate reductase [Breoghania corrubedonensis]|uniref:Chromate reductase n=1 Tax=Breoghania corrubedonensis TaxID=665038 RepID=A0A2T5V4S5_9HYPH|nr:NAD(P)H-dependent oxidoreductase [Breoghania corrubedonensis]PTW58749.1 chromate reductase [Breoghania corrubedonensis]